MPLATIEQALEDYRAGRMVIIVDDEDRENEGDLACAAEKVTPEIINFMAREGRGLICLPLTEERCDELRLPLQVAPDENGTQFGTAFTISIEARVGVTTGISAADRATTILVAANPASKAADLVRPGHIFPLRARRGGVLIRPGQTEAGVDLARLAGLVPAGVICEIMNDDGTMMRLPELEVFAARHDLKIISVADLIRYRIQNEISVRREAEAVVPTIHGEFKAIAFENLLNGEVHLAMVMGEITPDEPVLVRVHTQSVLSDVFGSLRDGHGAQLHLALEHIKREGKGIVLYLKQEMRGVGLADQLRVYREPGVNAQQTRRDPMRDIRDYGTGAQILHELGVRKLRLLSNHPPKLHALEGFDLEIIGHVPLTV
ncbi:MAG TPA: 3,4-dihydroxy-2-butanone-4-phosphate synthase [Blastocatellia bacterium]|nr:3,4-dihydroxy-2-butanone-4-phosphate synthase [Blastocatellia bacterium]HMV86446.1 3,4-dihydroxy-2-butanone-4-phosphate synthase [Blastocatellia bacterium]HMY71454.1 3,4-dihydroxy-2-butanone-4-phosphate synthase [Blastocatellia bacterium]HMZ17118.1 3,4-dihydroxy-2-butanone-4-phosphate synthase [Blastocatellia bacterium]HNG32632.1 3,4-dihydroxy-2-butanone-4-phosphate synthase [Blastocatellia bacterium]